jgi:hypothetical protein
VGIAPTAEERPVILHLAQGEPSYLPDGLLVPTRDQAHPDLMPLLHHFESRTVAWEAAALLVEHDGWCPLETLADGLCAPFDLLLPQLWPLVESGLLQERLQVTGLQYRLGANHRLRRLAQLLATGFAEAP